MVVLLPCGETKRYEEWDGARPLVGKRMRYIAIPCLQSRPWQCQNKTHEMVVFRAPHFRHA